MTFINVLRMVTEIVDLTNGNNRVIDPNLPANDYSSGMGLFVVPVDFCSKQK